MKKKLLDAIDYMFFRLEKVYLKKEGEGTFSAIMIISVFLMLTILCPFLIIVRNLDMTAILKTNRTLILILILSVQLIFAFIFYLRYRKIGESLKLKWDNEKEPNKTNHGILIVFVLLSPLILLFLDVLI